MSTRRPAVGFASLRELIDRSPALKPLREHQRQGGLREAWRRAVGEPAAALTRVTGLRGGKLQVSVASAPLLQELAAFRRQEILAALRSQAGLQRVVDIVFKQGC